MRLTLLSILVLFSSWQFAFSQDKQQNQLEKSILRLDVGVVGVWLDYERKIGQYSTMILNIGTAVSFPEPREDFGYVLIPNISIEPRYYYNLKKRIAREKNTLNNSANYLAITSTYFTPPFLVSNDDDNSVIIICPKWGLSRAIGKKFKFEFGLGMGMAITDKILPAVRIDLEFGYIISRK